jgi:NADPH:quinone reductase-like Zn-dependent oxidoreductase
MSYDIIIEFMGKLEGKIAVVTGGNSGIGLAVARLFVAEGAYVAITGRNQKTLRATTAELGNRILAIQADVTDIEATERAVAAAAEKFGKLSLRNSHRAASESIRLRRVQPERPSGRHLHPPMKLWSSSNSGSCGLFRSVASAKPTR